MQLLETEDVCSYWNYWAGRRRRCGRSAGYLSVRAVVRDAAKGAAWKERGCEVALAEMNDAPALTAAFTRVNGVFVLIPSNFDPMAGFPEVR